MVSGADGDHDRSFAHHQAHKLTAACTQRDANPEFLAPALDRLRRDAGQAQAGEHQAEQSDRQEHRRFDTNRALRFLQRLGQSLEVEERLRRDRERRGWRER